MLRRVALLVVVAIGTIPLLQFAAAIDAGATTSQTISFTSTAPSNGQSGDTYDVLATATSGLRVTFSVGPSSIACVISGSTVTLLGSGTCVIDANQSGNSTYSAAPQRTQSFSVSLDGDAAPFWTTALTPGPGVARAACGGATVWEGYTPETSGSIAIASTSTPGQVSVTFTINDGSPDTTYSVSRTCNFTFGDFTTNGAGTGSVTFTDSLSLGNSVIYNTTNLSTGQTFNETPVVVYELGQVITFSSSTSTAERFGGSYEPTATGGASGNPVTFAIDSSSTPGVCTYSSSTGLVSFAGIGTCVVDANQSGGGNYAKAQQVSQSLTISPAAQSVTFTSTPPASPAVGDAYTPTAVGGASGESVTFSIDPSATSGACIYSSSSGSVSITGPGECVLDANQSGATGYSAAPQVQQTFAITEPTVSTSPLSSTAAPMDSSSESAISQPLLNALPKVNIYRVHDPAGVPIDVACEVGSCDGTAEVSVARRTEHGWTHISLALGTLKLSTSSSTTDWLTLTKAGASILPGHVAFWTRHSGRFRMTLTVVLNGRRAPGVPVYIRS